MKILIQGKGSPRDPEYSEQMVSENKVDVSFLDFFHEKGIKTLERDLVTSCHGCTEMALGYAGQIQDLADNGHNVVGVFQGGLYFALPSIIAANAPTVPIISIPLDADYEGIDAFLAPQVPTGTSAIGGVGIEDYGTAANVAAGILNNDFKGVYVYETSEKLEKKLVEFGIPVLGRTEQGKGKGLTVGVIDIFEGNALKIDDLGDVGVFSPKGPSMLEDLAELMEFCELFGKSVYVREDENVAIFAAKILSANNPEIAAKLKAAAAKKAHEYEPRNLARELTGGN